MLDVHFDGLYRWGGLLRSPLVFPDINLATDSSAAGAALEAWTASMRTTLDQLNVDFDRIGAAVTACARNYEDVA